MTICYPAAGDELGEDAPECRPMNKPLPAKKLLKLPVSTLFGDLTSPIGGGKRGLRGGSVFLAAYRVRTGPIASCSERPLMRMLFSKQTVSLRAAEFQTSFDIDLDCPLRDWRFKMCEGILDGM